MSLQNEILALCGVKHAAQIIDRTPRTLKAYANKGVIPCLRDSSGRRLFRRADLERFNKDHPKSECSLRRTCKGAQ